MLSWTGERYLPWLPDDLIHYEHVHRYAVASRFVKGARVIDLACGEGYGAALLAERAAAVVGIDIDPATIEHAISSYTFDNLEFLIGSILNLPLREGAVFDYAICFEALEHVRDHDLLLGEVKRVLKDDGVLALSTPHIGAYGAAVGEASNPFHVHELSFEGFRRLLERHFRHVEYYGQRVYPASSIFQLAGGADSALEIAMRRRRGGYELRPIEDRVPRYLVALASDSRVPQGAASTLYDLSTRLLTYAGDENSRNTELNRRIDDEVQSYEAELTALRLRLAAVEAQRGQLVDGLEALRRELLSERDLFRERVQDLRRGLARSRERASVDRLQRDKLRALIADLRGRVDDAEAVYRQVMTSRSWRLTRPLRGAAATWRRIRQRPPCPGEGQPDPRDRNAGGYLDVSTSAPGPSAVQRRLLIVDARLCRPDQDAGSLRMYHIMKLCRELGFLVSFVAENLEATPPYKDAMESAGLEVLHWPQVDDIDRYLRLHGHQYDVVLLSRAEVAAAHIDAVRLHCPRAFVIFDTVDLHFLREQRRARLAALCAETSSNTARIERRARRLEAIEAEVMRKADVTLVVSDAEQELLQGAHPDVRVVRLSTIYEPAATVAPFEQRRDLLFFGGFQHPPNVDAAVHLVERVLPAILERCPAVKLRIAGSNAPAEVLALQRPAVEIVGYVEEPSPLFQESRVFVAPIRYGAGVKGKINHSMAFGLPVIATPVAVEGMRLRDGRDVLIATAPEDFAAAVARLYGDRDLWIHLSHNGLENVRRHFSPDVARATLQELLTSAMDRGEVA